MLASPERDRFTSARRADLHVLFVDATDEALLRRYSETRRPHPLSTVEEADGHALAVLDGIRIERERLAPLRARATRIIETTHSSVRDLRRLAVGPPRPADWERRMYDRPNECLELAQRLEGGRDHHATDFDNLHFIARNAAVAGARRFEIDYKIICVDVRGRFPLYNLEGSWALNIREKDLSRQVNEPKNQPREEQDQIPDRP